MEVQKENFMKSVSTDSSKNWLQRLKDESWEAELLVSAIAIFGTFQLFDLIAWCTNVFIDMLDPSQYVIGYFITFFGLFAVSVLVSMFIIHFFLRAYWIGLVGLNSVFPDYSIKNSAYSEVYTKNMLSKLPKLKDSIQKVDELCSVIFSVAFTFLLMYMYFAISASVYLLVYNLLSDYVPSYILLIPVICLLIGFIIQVVVSVIANLKANKEKENLQLWSFRIDHFISIISVGPLYKSILQVLMVFGSNYKKKKSLVYLMLLFILSGTFVAMFQVMKTNIFYLINHELYFDETKAYSGFYESKNEQISFLLAPEIDTDIVKTDVVRLFIPIFKNERKFRKENCEEYIENPDISSVEQRKERQTNLLECYHSYNLVYLNDKKISVDFLRYYHQKTNQFGILGYINLKNLKSGTNSLTIKKEFGDTLVSEWKIPFYYNANN